MVPQPIIDEVDGANIGIISLGSNDPAVEEKRDRLLAVGVKSSYLRLRALPISQPTRDFIEKYDHVFIVENNFDGQQVKIWSPG